MIMENIPTEKFDSSFITEKNSGKNIKGSHTFERYENKVTEDEGMSTTIIPERSTKDRIMTTEEILLHTKTESNNDVTTEKSASLSTWRHYIVDNIDYDATSMSSNEPIASTTTLNNKFTTADVTNHISTLKFAEQVTSNRYSHDKYYSSEESEFNLTDNTIISVPSTPLVHFEEAATESSTSEYEKSETHIVTDDITSSTLSIQLTNQHNASVVRNSTSQYEGSEIDIITDNIISSTTSNLSTDLNETSSTEYSSAGKDYFEKSQSDVTNNIISTRLDSEKIDNTSRYVSYEESFLQF